MGTRTIQKNGYGIKHRTGGAFYVGGLMAKDDYYILAGKILVYLYARLKGKNDQKPKEYLHALLKNNSDNSMTAL